MGKEVREQRRAHVTDGTKRCTKVGKGAGRPWVSVLALEVSWRQRSRMAWQAEQQAEVSSAAEEHTRSLWLE